MTQLKRTLKTIAVAVALPFGVGLGWLAATPKPEPVEWHEATTVNECATRAVYYLAYQDDYAMRALIAYAAIKDFSALGVAAVACSYPSPQDAEGTLDPYRWQAATDAVQSIASGDFVVPNACAGASEVLSASASPRAQCVVGDLAFVEGTFK